MSAVLAEAQFDRKVRHYWLVGVVIFSVLTMFGIPLLLLTLPLAWYLSGRYLDRMSARMDERFLKVEKGILTRVEKNVPLEQITDMGIVEGPLMRAFGLKQLTVETAGQSSAGPLVTLLGVIDTEAFRDRVLAQRDVLRARTGSANATDASQSGADKSSDDVQVKMLATLERIEALLRQERDPS